VSSSSNWGENKQISAFILKAKLRRKQKYDLNCGLLQKTRYSFPALGEASNGRCCRNKETGLQEAVWTCSRVNTERVSSTSCYQTIRLFGLKSTRRKLTTARQPIDIGLMGVGRIFSKGGGRDSSGFFHGGPPLLSKNLIGKCAISKYRGVKAPLPPFRRPWSN